jgi:predicted ATPase
MHTIWILNKNHARDKTKLWKVGCVQGMRCTKEMYRFGYRIRRCTGLPMWKSRYRMHDEASNKR